MFLPEEAILLVIDIQGKLARLMHKRDELVLNVSKLIQSASYLEMPVIVTEQVPEKIGKTIPKIARLLKNHTPVAKECFSCCGDGPFMHELKSLNRKQIIVAGIEAHVCVYQTVCDLLKMNYDVQVVGDAVSSRTQANKYFAVDRMQFLGGGITSTEMILCELLRTSKNPRFKEVVGLIK